MVGKRKIKGIDYHTPGTIADIMGVSPVLIARLMDKHSDIGFKIAASRRFFYDDAVEFFRREKWDISLIKRPVENRLVWIGRVNEMFRDDGDINLSMISAVAKAARGEITGVVCLSSNERLEDLLDMCDAVSLSQVRVAIKLPDDYAASVKKKSFVWTFHHQSGHNHELKPLFKWLRGIEEDPETENKKILEESCT
jgi:hypothetical protein